MWCCAGRSLLIATALAGCASDADAVITVRRAASTEIQVQLCPDDDGACQNPTADPLFTDSEPASASKTIEIYLDEQVDALQVHFTTPACIALRIPFGDGQRTPSVVLPDALDGCADCTLGPCL